MLSFALNQMTVPARRHGELMRLAASLGCVGVEIRNDLGRPVFDGASAVEVRAAAAASGQRIVGLSQVYPFNDWSVAIAAEVRTLIANAKACGAETISLIPRNDGSLLGEAGVEGARTALAEILPMLQEADVVALVEPLGFPRTSSLRHKAETIALIDAVGGAGRYKIVHDTFHHFLSHDAELYPEWTGIVHVSGVTDPGIAPEDFADADRVLVDADDRLGNAAQIATLLDAGWAGVISMEAFSPAVHGLADPETALRRSFDHLEREVAARRVSAAA
jgi:2-keto-myo-inositol isomerase